MSVGTSIAKAAYSVAQRAATELITKGAYTALEGGLDFGRINSVFTR